MALIKCPECKKKISDQCENCPSCGYPIKANLSAIETETGTKADCSKDVILKTLQQKWWFWVTVGVVIVAVVVTTILILNSDTKPKFDKDGNPMFVEMTNEVYTKAKDYTGYHINIKGQVFQVIGDTGETKGIQIWLDPEACEQNLMIYYSTDVEVKQGDYISCSGYIDSVTKYKNAYGAELQVPLVFSSELKIATYIDVMAPTLGTITLENLKKESHGYTISVDKVEFSEKETRVYISVTNNGKATLYVGSSVIIQDGKQYKSTTNYDADYEEIPYEILKGASSTGIIVFPAINSADFELSFEIHSDDFDERLGEYAFEIRKNNSSIKAPETPIEVITPVDLKQEKYRYSVTIDKVEFYSEETRIHLTVVNNGTALLYVDSDGSVILQEGKQYNTTHNYNADYAELPYEIIKGATVSGAVSFPKMSSNDFELTIDLYSDNYDEKLEKFVFKISKNSVAPPSDKPTTSNKEPSNKQESTSNGGNSGKCLNCGMLEKESGSNYCYDCKCSYCNEKHSAIGGDYCDEHKCQASGCVEPHNANGYCWMHNCGMPGCDNYKDELVDYCDACQATYGNQCQADSCSYEHLFQRFYCYGHNCTAWDCCNYKDENEEYCESCKP